MTSAQPSAENEAVVSAGRLRGERTDGGLTVFRGVPYARAGRFTPPEPVEPWPDVRDATSDGPISPQPPSRLGAVMGPPRDGLVQADDCLNLTVVTPDTGGRRPVMVWIHGGAYVTGASSFGFYDGRRLTVEGDIVFVAINYRLGALGYLQLDGVSPGNLGLLDQLAALRWVKENIAAFGGDPDQVTVFGQSAGAHSLACLLAMPAARGLFRRAILQSPPLGLGLASPARAARIARYFTTALGRDPRSATVDEIVSAQTAAIVRASGPGGLGSPPFCPTAGAGPLSGLDRWPAALTVANVDVLIGFTRSEMNSFVNGKPETEWLTRLPFIGRRVFEAVKAIIGRRIFDSPSLKLADACAAAGRQVFTYRFDWAPPGSIFGACHCIELPFLLGDQKAWAAAPMLGDASWDGIDEFGHDLRRAWLSFACDGKPDGWRAHHPGAGIGKYWLGPVSAPAAVTEAA
ncbi:carboxylesterase/lipase family protein [Amycolatopsis taiwanensis]|uniref:Carboxylic ester hydrolase n=1 Tax=Amycolatopsis taiwanensis TaxID=342230 RepID=A0A9W6R3K4_9PSEU|nr:carboxylesterase family protein [Amycolatopsis taiwanensis]GLY68869.1 carboxylic ester hydrolase [Amycolatopsis taiwanensis]